MLSLTDCAVRYGKGNLTQKRQKAPSLCEVTKKFNWRLPGIQECGKSANKNLTVNGYCVDQITLPTN